MEVVSNHGVETNVAVNGDNNTEEAVCDGVGAVDGRGSEQRDHGDGQETFKVPVVGSMELVRGGDLVGLLLVDIGY